MILAGVLLFYGTLAKIDAANVVMAYLAAHTKAMLVIVVVIGLSAKTAADTDSVGEVFEGLVRASTSLSMCKNHWAAHQNSRTRYYRHHCHDWAQPLKTKWHRSTTLALSLQ